MKTFIKKLGNRAAIFIPASIMGELGWSIGQNVNIEIVGDNLLVKLKNSKKYTLKELIDQCDIKAPMPTAVSEWEF